VIRWLARALGGLIARYLNGCIHRYEPFAITDPHKLSRVLQPADVLLVEGDRRISTAIKYLTQSTWSHAAIYVGDRLDPSADPLTARVLVEADLEEGVVAVPLGKYAELNTRICRAVGLTPETQRQVVDYVVARLGNKYDLKNVIDLARYLLPTPPVPVSWRRRMLALGSGDPTRAICSTLIAQAFQSIRYPILPHIERPETVDKKLQSTVKEILHIRHYSLFAPRDFDISPYFRVIKPTIEHNFDYRVLSWADSA
jgi:hypothetical protein